MADELARALVDSAPTVLVFEDVHWADEATLDVLRLVARRIASLPAVVVATYREDSLCPAHPLRPDPSCKVRPQGRDAVSQTVPWRDYGGMESTTKRMELDHRESDGVAVTLSWDCAANRVIVSVVDIGSGEAFELTIEDANARDAFEHPFAYAAFRGALRRETQPIAA